MGMELLREGKRGVASIIRCQICPEIGEMNRKEDWNKELGHEESDISVHRQPLFKPVLQSWISEIIK